MLFVRGGKVVVFPVVREKEGRETYVLVTKKRIGDDWRSCNFGTDTATARAAWMKVERLRE